MTAPLTGFVCTRCARRQEAAGSCAQCGADDCVLDLGQRGVCELLTDMDDRRRDVHEARLRWAAVGVAMLLGAAVVVWARWILILVPPIPFPFFLRVILLMSVLGVGLLTAAMKLWPARPRFGFARSDEPDPP